MPRIAHHDLADTRPVETSESIRCRVEQARRIQQERFPRRRIHSHACMGPLQLQAFCRTDASGQNLLQHITDRLGQSARAYTRLFKVARIIADLANSEEIAANPLAEAIQSRSPGRQTV